MTAPRGSFARDDAVLWRWPAGPWEWLRAGAWVWGAGAITLVSIFVGASAGMAFLVGNYLRQQYLAEAGTVLIQGGLVLLVGLAFTSVPVALLFAYGYIRVPRLTLTARDFRVESRLPWRRAKTVPRSEIRAAVVYEGDGVVFLMGDGRELLHVRHVGTATAFADALAAPTLTWPVRKPAKAVEWLTTAHMASVGLLPLVAMAVTLILINMIVGGSIGYFPRVLGSLVGGTIMGGLLAPVPVLAIGRHFVSTRTLDDFVARGIDLVRWQGRSPSR